MFLLIAEISLHTYAPQGKEIYVHSILCFLKRNWVLIKGARQMALKINSLCDILD